MSSNPVVKIIEQSAPPSVVKSDVDQQEYPVAKVQQAYRTYMLDDKRLSDIAKDIGVPLVIVEEWCLKYGWANRKSEYAAQTIKSLNAELNRRQAEERVNTITGHIAKARDIVEKAHGEAMRSGTPRGLKEAVDAMTAAATMEARAAGLAEKTVQRDVGPGGVENADANKMVWIGVSVLPKTEPAKVIDVQSEVLDAQPVQ